jgi:hypothetical protein
VNQIDGIEVDDKYHYYFEYELSISKGSEVYIRDGIAIFSDEQQKIVRYADRELYEDYFSEFEVKTKDVLFEFSRSSILIKK